MVNGAKTVVGDIQPDIGQVRHPSNSFDKSNPNEVRARQLTSKLDQHRFAAPDGNECRIFLDSVLKASASRLSGANENQWFVPKRTGKNKEF